MRRLRAKENRIMNGLLFTKSITVFLSKQGAISRTRPLCDASSDASSPCRGLPSGATSPCDSSFNIRKLMKCLIGGRFFLPVFLPVILKNILAKYIGIFYYLIYKKFLFIAFRSDRVITLVAFQ